jgi:hypothetical protein
VVLGLSGPSEGAQPIADAAQDLCDQLLLGTEMMEQDRCLGTQRGGQWPKGQIRDAVGYDVVDRSVEQFLSAL